MSQSSSPSPRQLALLYHHCRLQLPDAALGQEVVERHLRRTFQLFEAKNEAKTSWVDYLANLYALDWYIVVGCLEGNAAAWDHLFAARAGRADCLLVDALRARAVRLYPRNEERQEGAVAEFWSHLLVADTPGSLPVLARYDGQRPLVPWLIRVFQNWHISQLRHSTPQPLPEDDRIGAGAITNDGHWHEAFRIAARDFLGNLTEGEVLILGLRLRYRLSQREVAGVLEVHEGTVSRQTTHLRDRYLDFIGKQLLAAGWTGDDLSAFVLNEMASVLLDDPRLSAERLAKLLAKRGKKLNQ